MPDGRRTAARNAVSTFVLLGCAQALAGTGETVVLREDFDTSVGGMPDPDKWIVNHPGQWWWVQGRTHFPNAAPWLPTGEFPRVENGVCVIEHHRFNPYDLGATKTSFLGGEIRTVREFDPNRVYCFEARVRSHPYPNGLVTSFFVYGYDGSKSDEIDFEFVSKKTNDNAIYPDGDPVLANPWNESHQCPEYVVSEGLDLTEWHTFRIYWNPSLRLVEWTWLHPSRDEVSLRTETAASCVPDEPMALYFNFWAPVCEGPSAWPDACDSDLQPVQDENADDTWRYEIDWVEVRMHEPSTDFDADGDVDLVDFAHFCACFNGPNRQPAAPRCLDADCDLDGDVDLDDFSCLSLCFNGPNSPPACK